MSLRVVKHQDVNKAVASVDVTILQTIASDGSVSETMMTVAEAEFAYNANVGPAKPEELPLEAIVATTTGNYEVNGGAAEGPAEKPLREKHANKEQAEEDASGRIRTERAKLPGPKL